MKTWTPLPTRSTHTQTWRKLDLSVWDEVLNIAHRGYAREWPGNTLEAIEGAISLGVDAVEVDVQETGDEGFILAHDWTVQGRAICELTLGEAMGLDVGGGCTAPTLEEALDLCRGEVGVALELKEVRTLGRLLEIVRSSGEEGKTGMCSFDAELLRGVREQGSGLRLGLITDAPPPDPESVLRELGCEVIGVRAPHISEGLVKRVQGSGRMVFGWGMEDAAGVSAVLGLGVDGLVSDFPDVVKEVLGRGG